MKPQVKVICTLIVMCISSCKKDKQTANDFAGKNFRITELTIDNALEDNYTTLEFMDCKIYKEKCTGTWKDDNYGNAEFIWQVNEKGTKFTLSNQTTIEMNGNNYPQYLAVEDCYQLSGTYSIISNKKDKGIRTIQLESYTTAGYSGNKVAFLLRQE